MPPKHSIQTILRLRPVLKKERDEPVLVEPIDDNTLVLHPVPNTRTPSSQLVLQTLSPDTVHTLKDAHFPFNHVTDGSQERIWRLVGHNIAKQAMEALQNQDTTTTTSSSSNQLLVSMGLAGAGKSFTLVGEMNKRKHTQDGILPRFIDSVFAQAAHQKVPSFGVRITALLINQTKGTDECKVYNLLLKSSQKSATSSTNNNNNSTTVRSLVANFEKQGTSTPQLQRHKKNMYGTLTEDDESSSVHHDYEQATTATQARELILQALTQSRKLAARRCHSHVWIQLQPYSNHNTQGPTVALVDLAPVETATTSSRRTAGKESVTRPHAAYQALLHVLRLLHQQQPPSKIPFGQHRITQLLQPLVEKGVQVQLMVCVAPTETRAELRSLLQEIDGVNGGMAETGVDEQGERPPVVTKGATPHYKSWKSLLNRDEEPHEPRNKAEVFKSPLPTKVKETKRGISPPSFKSPLPVATLIESKHISTRKKTRPIVTLPASDADDERSMSEPKCEIPETIPHVSSMTYSESTLDDGDDLTDDDYIVPLPPPFAPSSTRSLPQGPVTPTPVPIAAKPSWCNTPTAPLLPPFGEPMVAQVPDDRSPLKATTIINSAKPRSSVLDGIEPRSPRKDIKDENASWYIRWKEVCTENDELRRENHSLRERQRQLVSENEKLRSKASKKSFSDDDADDERDWAESKHRLGCPSRTIDDPLMQHIATLSTGLGSSSTAHFPLQYPSGFRRS